MLTPSVSDTAQLFRGREAFHENLLEAEELLPIVHLIDSKIFKLCMELASSGVSSQAIMA